MTADVLSIRRLAARDAEILKPFRLSALADGQDAFSSSPEEWDRPLDEFRAFLEKQHAFGAFDGDGNLAGMAVLGVTARDRLKTRHKAEIWSVYVAGRHRRKGLARRLAEACITEARGLGFEALVLTATARNTHVWRFYESLGFRIYGTEPRALKLPDGTLLDEHLMQLDL
jgi:ribosomal protein S18 acetylase RimI-like enzyme